MIWCVFRYYWWNEMPTVVSYNLDLDDERSYDYNPWLQNQEITHVKLTLVRKVGSQARINYDKFYKMYVSCQENKIKLEIVSAPGSDIDYASPSDVQDRLTQSQNQEYVVSTSAKLKTDSVKAKPPSRIKKHRINIDDEKSYIYQFDWSGVPESRGIGSRKLIIELTRNKDSKTRVDYRKLAKIWANCQSNNAHLQVIVDPNSQIEYALSTAENDVESNLTYALIKELNEYPDLSIALKNKRLRSLYPLKRITTVLEESWFQKEILTPEQRQQYEQLKSEGTLSVGDSTAITVKTFSSTDRNAKRTARAPNSGSSCSSTNTEFGSQAIIQQEIEGLKSKTQGYAALLETYRAFLSPEDQIKYLVAQPAVSVHTTTRPRGFFADEDRSSATSSKLETPEGTKQKLESQINLQEKTIDEIELTLYNGCAPPLVKR